MRSLVLIQINNLGSLADSANRCFLNRFTFSNQRDDAAIVVGIHFAVE